MLAVPQALGRNQGGQGRFPRLVLKDIFKIWAAHGKKLETAFIKKVLFYVFE